VPEMVQSSPHAISGGRLPRHSAPQTQGGFVTVTARRWYSCASMPASPARPVSPPWVSGASTPVQYPVTVSHSSSNSHPVSGAATPRAPDSLVTAAVASVMSSPSKAHPLMAQPTAVAASERPLRVPWPGCGLIKEDGPAATVSTRSTTADSSSTDDDFLSTPHRSEPTDRMSSARLCEPAPAAMHEKGRTGPSLTMPWSPGTLATEHDSLPWDGSGAAPPVAVSASPAGSFSDERMRLRQLSAVLKADIDRADQILQEIDPTFRQEESTVTSVVAASSDTCAASQPQPLFLDSSDLTENAESVAWQSSVSIAGEEVGESSFQGQTLKDASQLAVRKKLEAAVKCFEGSSHVETASVHSTAIDGGSECARIDEMPHLQGQQTRRPPRSPMRCSSGGRSSSQGPPLRAPLATPEASTRQRTLSPTRRRAVSVAVNRYSTPEPSPMPQQPAPVLSPSAQLARHSTAPIRRDSTALTALLHVLRPFCRSRTSKKTRPGKGSGKR